MACNFCVSSFWISFLILFLNLISHFRPVLSKNNVNERPIVGIPTMSITDELLLKKVSKLKDRKYIAASYVKFIEMAGARAVPIPTNINDTVLQHVFKSVNGLLFPGGETNLVDSGYYKLTKRLYELAIKENEKGKVFPILGICRGMQAMLVHTEGSIDVMEERDSVNLTTTLTWNDENFEKSFIKDMPPPMKEVAEKKKITAHFHKYGVTKEIFSKGKVGEKFNVVATSFDRENKEFVSIFQGKELPFFGLQFHPEKVLFEWAETINIPHSLDAVYLSQFFSNAFMGEVRKNKAHRFSSWEETERYTTSKDPMYYTGFLPDAHSPFMQIFVY